MASWYSMRFAIVDDLDTERTLLKERLARQLRQRGTEAELLEFDSGEAFLAAEKERRFTAAFLDIYMEGLSGMDAARELRKTDTDCLLVFTTTSTDHALEGFQVRAFHYLVKPFSETELSGLLDEMLSKLPRPEPILTVKVDGSDIRLRYRDIISAEHFAHMINIRTTAGKTLATRQSFKAFTEPLKKDPRFFVCGRGAIINMENAADFQDPVEMIPRYVKEWENGYKIVIGIKKSSQENKLMYWLRGCYYKLIKKLSDVEQIEQFTGFGLYDKKFINVMRELNDPTDRKSVV